MIWKIWWFLNLQNLKPWLMLNVISGHWQGGIGEIVSPPSSWELEVSYDTIQYLITRLQFDIIAVKVNYLGKVKSTKNSKILNLLINGFYHSNKSSADFQSNYKSNSNSKMSKSRKLVRNSPISTNVSLIFVTKMSSDISGSK